MRAHLRQLSRLALQRRTVQAKDARLMKAAISHAPCSTGMEVGHDDSCRAACDGTVCASFCY